MSSVDCLHGDDTLLINNNEPFLAIAIILFHHVELNLFETLFGSNQLPVEAETNLLILVPDWLIGSLQIYEELLSPLESRMPLNVLKDLLHSLDLLLTLDIYRLSYSLCYLVHVIRIDGEGTSQCSGASSELRHNTSRLFESLLPLFDADKFHGLQAEAVSQ